MTAGGDASLIAQGLAISPDSSRVVYRANTEEPHELWLRYFRRVPRPVSGPGASVTRGL